jgi:hypothetical protein
MSKRKARGTAPGPEGSKNADPLAPMLEDKIFMPGDMFRLIVERADADGLERIAAELGKRQFSAILETYRRDGIPFDLEEVMAEILSGYYRMFRIEESSTYGGRRVMKLSHKWGPKWSRYLRGYLRSACSTASKEGVEIEINDQFVQVSFVLDRAPPR